MDGYVGSKKWRAVQENQDCPPLIQLGPRDALRLGAAKVT